MSEILIVVRDKPNPPKGEEAMWWKRFDTVDVQPDGHGWGTHDLQMERFRIIRSPNTLTATAEALTVPGKIGEASVALRKNQLDVASLPAKYLTLFDAPRRGPYIDIPDINLNLRLVDRVSLA